MRLAIAASAWWRWVRRRGCRCRVTGSDSYILKITATSIEHLEALIDRFNPYGQITTALVLSSAVVRHQIEPPEREPL